MPLLSPSAWARHLPRQMPTSSTVWCESTWRSPWHFTVTSNSPCLARCVSIWSKKPTPVASSCRPVPSRLRDNSIFVSVVSRRMVAVRDMASGCEYVGQFLQQRIDFVVGPDGHAESVPIVRVVHVPDQHLARLQRLVERSDRSVRSAGPDEVRQTWRHGESQSP